MNISATARLQLHGGFTLDDAAGVADYYAALGISHLYLSPLFSARKGSTHGYDVTDPTTVNPELGGMAAFERLAARARSLGLGIILDIVPNHMAATSPENAWWADVLRKGSASRHAQTFDIDWNRPGIAGKVLLPILGRPYGAALAAGDVELVRDPASGAFGIHCGGQILPLSAESEARLMRGTGCGSLAGVTGLHELLEEQHYRLAWWRTAADDINWRRFFEISELVGVKVERPDVFEMTHSLIFQLYGQGCIDGVRIDHIDGLADPAGYLARLRERLSELASGRPAGCRKEPYVIVEKILARDERLRSSWAVEGTTGYDFMDEVSAVLHDANGEKPLTQLWEGIAPGQSSLETLVAQARHTILTVNLASELTALCALCKRLADTSPATRDFSLTSIRRTLAALLESWRVYRTYFDGDGHDAADMALLKEAAAKARAKLEPADRPALDVLVTLLFTPTDSEVAEPLRREAVTRFQQLTSPLAAKSLEDTVFYRYGRLLSRNEVGSDPAVFSLSPEEFHQRMMLRLHEHPHSLLATATHDHKRGEDGRARLAVLSEIPEMWTKFMTVALADTAGHEQNGDCPDTVDRSMLLQTLIGAWPPGLKTDDRDGLTVFLNRVQAWQVKALREAKRRSTWVSPDTGYEERCRQYLHRLADDATASESLLGLAQDLVTALGPAGAVNSLSQTMLRMTAPGIPDLYQGTEGWDFSMVDPDNRRPVEYQRQRRLLADGRDWDTLLSSWHDGGVKQRLIRQTLHFRKRFPLLFSDGEYIPLTATGERSRQCLAFMRRYRDQRAIVIVSRLVAGLTVDGAPLVCPKTWMHTAIGLPADCAGQWRDVIASTTHDVHNEMASPAQQVSLALGTVLARAPVALLTQNKYCEHRLACPRT